MRHTPAPFPGQLPAGWAQTTPELRALVTRAYVRGLSARDIEGLYTEVFGGRFSRSAASRAAKSLQADFDAWRQRDLSDLQVVYLFLDGQFHAARSGTREKEGILAAYAILEDGRAVLLHLGLGPRESTDAWVAFLHDLTARGLGEPLLLILDGNPGLLRAVKQVFPRVRRQRCQVHKMRNILAKLPRLTQRELKPLLHQVFLAPDQRTALRRGRALLARFRGRFPSAMECLEKDLEECCTYLGFPGGAGLPHAPLRHAPHRHREVARRSHNAEDPAGPRCPADRRGSADGADCSLTSDPTPGHFYTEIGT